MELAGGIRAGLDVLSTLRSFLDSLHTDLADGWTRPKQRRDSTSVAPRGGQSPPRRHMKAEESARADVWSGLSLRPDAGSHIPGVNGQENI